MSNFRALTIFEDLPAGHKAVLVRHGGFEPHLKPGEFAVVDTTEKDVQDGELYMIWINRSIGGPILKIVQPSHRKFYNSEDGHCVGIGWKYGLARPGCWVFGDGPVYPSHWAQKCLGRIVGIYEPLMTELCSDNGTMRALW